MKTSPTIENLAHLSSDPGMGSMVTISLFLHLAAVSAMFFLPNLASRTYYSPVYSVRLVNVAPSLPAAAPKAETRKEAPPAATPPAEQKEKTKEKEKEKEKPISVATKTKEDAENQIKDAVERIRKRKEEKRVDTAINDIRRRQE